jgi:hypothetical protein
MSKLEKLAGALVRKKVLRDFTFQDVQDAMEAMDSSQRNRLMSAVGQRHSLHVGRVVLKAIDSYATAMADAEATAALADDVLTKQELKRVFED